MADKKQVGAPREFNEEISLVSSGNKKLKHNDTDGLTLQACTTIRRSPVLEWIQ